VEHVVDGPDGLGPTEAERSRRCQGRDDLRQHPGSGLVRGGDTLWDIATAHTAPGDDVRDTLLDIRRANGLTTSVISPGQVLVIPTAG
jgi:hypothetical protein